MANHDIELAAILVPQIIAALDRFYDEQHHGDPRSAPEWLPRHLGQLHELMSRLKEQGAESYKKFEMIRGLK